MRYGFTIPARGPLANPQDLATIAKRGEELGYHLLLAADHIAVPRSIASTYPYTEGGEFPGSDSGEALEQLTILSFVAGQTRTIRLGTSVMIVPHRNPLVAAKALATLDVLSGGRVVVGVGVGWMREEFEALGLPPFERRGDVTDEYLQAFKELWTSDNPTFEGNYCRFSNIDFLPKPVQAPHPPIWVGGESRRALRRAARLGDAWYPIGSNPAFPLEEREQLEAAMKRLAAYAREAGRDPAQIEVAYRTHRFELRKGDAPASSTSQRVPFTGTANEIAADIRAYQEMGVSHLVVDPFRRGPSLDDALRQMEEMATLVWPRV